MILFRFASALLTAGLFVLVFLLAISTRLIELPSAYDPFKPIDLRAAPTMLTPWKLARLDASPDLCEAALDRAGARYSPLPGFETERGCSFFNAGAFSSTGKIAMSPRSADIRCPVAARLVMLEQQVILPAAQRYLGSAPVTAVHLGGYVCRTIGRRAGGRLSQHAYGNAIDIAGFRMGDGTSVSLLDDWDDTGEKGAFLRRVRDGACDLFSVVLGPDYNADHEDHFHFDLGFYRRCS